MKIILVLFALFLPLGCGPRPTTEGRIGTNYSLSNTWGTPTLIIPSPTNPAGRNLPGAVKESTNGQR